MRGLGNEKTRGSGFSVARGQLALEIVSQLYLNLNRNALQKKCAANEPQIKQTRKIYAFVGQECFTA